ncbi:alpha/beta fold hydrolase [Azospirillum brasilense]|uniref:Alpha/beta hydrolase n=1 Tax=Azospirillum brasilense TaxID=192 RepID=A0A235H6F8_AZOBR|nr:alpha/beta fold hydrolase [Azospirillum brasilense]OYD81369.1 alpha/beta hydrolase [Azospirillum brasilense]
MTGRIERSPRRGRAEIEGGPAAYLSMGQGGVPVLLLHGFAGDSLTWQFNAAALAADRRVLAVDLPGHGASTLEVGDGRVGAFAPWLLRLLNALEIQRVHAVGHSMGGYVALELARLAPGRVASLSLVASAGLGPDFDLEFLRRVAALETVEEGRDCAARLFARPWLLAGRVGEVMHAQATDPRRRAALERIIAGSFAEAHRSPAPVDWTAFPMPIQLLWGREDRIIPVPTADRLPPAAPLHLFDKAGHLPHSEAATPVTAILRDFLSACDSQ